MEEHGGGKVSIHHWQTSIYRSDVNCSSIMTAGTRILPRRRQ